MVKLLTVFDYFCQLHKLDPTYLMLILGLSWGMASQGDTMAFGGQHPILVDLTMPGSLRCLMFCLNTPGHSALHLFVILMAILPQARA